jgi:hypothetical protein
MALSFDHGAKRIVVPQADAVPLPMQALINAIREHEASERGIVEDQIADAAGKDILGPGITTAITVNLRSTWVLNFAAGAYQAVISGGNLADGLARVFNTGSPQVLLQSSAAATLVTGSGGAAATPAEIANAVTLALQAVMLPVDTRRMNGADVVGDGSAGNKWRGAGV